MMSKALCMRKPSVPVRMRQVHVPPLQIDNNEFYDNMSTTSNQSISECITDRNNTDTASFRSNATAESSYIGDLPDIEVDDGNETDMTGDIALDDNRDIPDDMGNGNELPVSPPKSQFMPINNNIWSKYSQYQSPSALSAGILTTSPLTLMAHYRVPTSLPQSRQSVTRLYQGAFVMPIVNNNSNPNSDSDPVN